MDNNRIPSGSPDLTQDNIIKLKKLFPEIITDGKVDFDMLKTILEEEIDDRSERYRFEWHGKKESMLGAQKPSKGTLRPDKEASKNYDTTGNLYIEGDNLEVLKLLQKSYNGKVKMIYIDPPYNTGNDFVYKDDFQDNIKNYLEQTGQIDGDGKKVSTNTETSGRKHTNWLNMMYPRLKLARNLLTDDGVIFISIDDNELRNLRNICDEVFGEENFIAQMAVQLNPRGRNLDKYIAKTHEHVVVYAKNYGCGNTMVGIPKEGKMVSEYNKEDSRGKYRVIGLRNRNQSFNPITRPSLYYPLYVNPINNSVSLEQNSTFTDEVWPDTPDGIKTCWTWGKPKVSSENDLIIAERFGDEWRIYRKDYLYDDTGKMSTTLIKSLWTDKEINNDYGKKSIKNLFNSSLMDFPKSPDLIQKLIKPSVEKEGIILDFFSGSATTAHAVMKLNAEDDGKRKFIMVQLPEEVGEKTEAYKAGYKNINQIGQERIRRAGEKILEEYPEAGEHLDIGFKVLKLDKSNIREWNVDFKELEHQITSYDNMFVPNRTELDIVYEIMLKYGLELTYPINNFRVDEKNIYDIAFGNLFICLDDNIDTTIAQAIIDKRNDYGIETSSVVFADHGFHGNDSEKLNCFKLLEDAGYQDEQLMTI